MTPANQTKGKAIALPTKDKDGRSYMTVILRRGFVAKGAVLEDLGRDVQIDLVDTYNGDDGAGSIRRPSMLFDFKPGTDVVLLGHAHPQRGSTTQVDVSLRVGDSIDKTVRAFGARTWQAGSLGGVSPGPALPIREPVPLIYELAWGGMDLSDPEKPLGEPRNYVGRGVHRRPRSLIDTPATRLESPRRDGARTPASFGPIHRHWQTRVSFAGTYDEEWMEHRMPLLPRDFDDRFNVCVPDDQWCPRPLRGDESFEITNATPDGHWHFQLPRIAPGFSSIILGKREEYRTHLDTILLDADQRTVELTWRAAIPAPPKLEMIERLIVLEKRVI